MTDLEPIRQRFLRENPQQRLGHLAADLLRIANFVETGSHNAAIPIIRESKFMAEWAAPETNLKTCQLLAEAQSFLALKESQWPIWTRDKTQTLLTVNTVRRWSNDLLKLAGLLNP